MWRDYVNWPFLIANSSFSAVYLKIEEYPQRVQKGITHLNLRRIVADVGVGRFFF